MTRRVTDPYGAMRFDYGHMLTVRRGGVDEYGDPIGWDDSHQIGPCAVRESEQQINTDGDGPRNRTVYTVSAPPESDVKETDRVVMPDGTEAVVTVAPSRPRNPFTGWQPFVRFTASGA